MRVLFPDPVAPTIATVRPGSAVKQMSSSTGASAPGYWKVTSRNSSLPRARGAAAGRCGGCMAGWVSSTSVMRSALTTARGTIMNMNVAIMTAIRIWSMYCRNAVRAPTSICPWSTRWPPNHSTAAVARCMTMLITGNISTNSAPILREMSVMSWLARAKRRVSKGSFTNARITRMPVICSRSTPLMPSMRSCMVRNHGMSRETTSPSSTPITGMETHTSHDSPGSSRRAMMIPPTHMMGAMTMKFRAMSVSIWICWTSLVLRVISEGAPKLPTSRALNEPTRRNTLRRRSRPTPIAVRAPHHTATTAETTWTRATASITAPVLQM